jgi:hypothetical protein
MFRVILALATRLPAFVADLSEALDGPGVTPQEGEDLAAKWSRQSGDVLRIRVGPDSIDVVGPESQELLARAIGRIIARIHAATSGA